MQTRLSHVIVRMTVGVSLAVNPIQTLAETIEAVSYTHLTLPTNREV